MSPALSPSQLKQADPSLVETRRSNSRTIGKCSLPNLTETLRCTWRKSLTPYDKSRKTSMPAVDIAMSALAIFSFKWPSLLCYDKQRRDETVIHNLRNLFSLQETPCDTQMRERLDEIPPAALRKGFNALFSLVQRQKLLEEYTFLDGHYLLSVDGTGYFSSDAVHCEHCCQKQHKSGRLTYYHQMLCASLVHPWKKQVFPFAPEPILKTDGAKKNDCERNASKRFLEDLRREHPHLKLIVVEDGLASNGPHLKQLKALNMRFIVGAKPGDHPFLYDWVAQAEKETWTHLDKDGTQHRFNFVNEVPLNDSHFDFQVNFLDYTETKKNGKTQRFSWVTDIPITPKNVMQLMRGGRARWKIENETFNTLKNQGYNYEHNYGHGNQYLCTNMGTMMLLAFFIDQIQQAGCQLYQRLRHCARTYYQLWEYLRVVLSLEKISGWEAFYDYILVRIDKTGFG